MASGKLSGIDLTTTGVTTLYQGVSGKITSCTISLCNRTGNPVIVNISLGAVSPTNTDYLEYGVTIPGFGILERSGIVLSGTSQYITVSALTANAITAMCFGYEE